MRKDFSPGDSRGVRALQIVVFIALLLGIEPILRATGVSSLERLSFLANPLVLAGAWLLWMRRGSLGTVREAFHIRAGLRRAVAIGVLFFFLHLVLNVVVEPFYEPVLLEIFGGDPDAHGERYAFLEGDLPALLGWIALIWVFAALGEELFFRGLLLTQIERVMGGSAAATVLAVVLSSVVFGLMHRDVGTWQVVSSTISGALIYAPAFLLARRNIVAPILAHGLWNTFGLTLLYFGVG